MKTLAILIVISTIYGWYSYTKRLDITFFEAWDEFDSERSGLLAIGTIITIVLALVAIIYYLP